MHHDRDGRRANEISEIDETLVAQQALVGNFLPSARAIMIRLLPVNSSAPTTSSRIRPRKNTTPPNKRPGLKPRLLLVITTTYSMAQKSMKAPASTPQYQC